MTEEILEKVCKKCSLTKLACDFPISKKNKDGRLGACKTCTLADQRARYAAKPEYAAKNAAYREANREEILEKRRAKYAADPSIHRAKTAAYIETNREEVNSRKRDAYVRDREKISARFKKYATENVDKLRAARQEKRDQIKARHQIWLASNRHVRAASRSRRRAAKMKAAPAWADKQKIQEFYFAARFLSMVTGEWYHVDHVVPLQSKIVCGLHCESNLAVVTSRENWAKFNTIWPDMP